MPLHHARPRPIRLAWLVPFLAAAACAAAPVQPSGAAPTAAAPPAGATPGVFSPAERLAADRVRADEISGHLRFLADDLLEGRGPGTRGDAIAVRYLAAQLEAAGLVPGMPGRGGAPRSWLQEVPLVKLTGRVPPAVEVRGAGGTLALSTRGGKEADLIVHPRAEVDRVLLRDAELVFVGYGITAPEYGWDDYRGADVRGKVVVILNFNPPFAGEGVRLQYGRWDYKYQNAADHGAAAAIIVHTTPSASYPWQVLTASADGTQMALPLERGERRLGAEMWIAEGAARKLFALAGQDLTERSRAAQDAARRGIAAAPLGVRLALDMPVARERVPSANVVGWLPGTDAGLAGEYVVYSAHHDHLGAVAPLPPATDGHLQRRARQRVGVRHGACHRARGRRRAATALAPVRLLHRGGEGPAGGALVRPASSGPRWKVGGRHQPRRGERLGRTTDLGALGLGKSSVDAVVREVAAAQGRTVHGDPFPDRGSFYRSDHLELARVGVPTVSVKGGPHYVGRPDDWGREVQTEYERKNYHQPSDEYPPAPGRWDLSGAVEDAQLQLVVGLRLANAPDLPRWTPGDEFESARLAAPR